MVVSYSKAPREDLLSQENNREERFCQIDENNVQYAACFIGPFSYCWDLTIHVPTDDMTVNDGLAGNLHIGDCCCIATNCTMALATNGGHNIREVSLGAFAISMLWSGIEREKYERTTINRGSIIIQNDVWIGDSVTIMGGVTVRNGAVIARNSHVVSDVPPYAIVGGNPAKVIGYRFPKNIIEQLQVIQWWKWDKRKLLQYQHLFNEDAVTFCEMFYQEAKEKYDKLKTNRKILDDAFFVFVDYYEIYSAYEKIIEEFLDHYCNDKGKRLVLFIRNDLQEIGGVDDIEEFALHSLYELEEKVSKADKIGCRIQVMVGDKEAARKEFINCSHFITSRVYDTVDFTCLADLLEMDLISGVDNHIAFEPRKNIIYH